MYMREIIVIAAMAENRVIGRDNRIPWSIKEDMARFRELTMGWPCIMGRKTWESLPKKPLPGRLNIVVSGTMTQAQLENPGELRSGIFQDVKIFPSLQAAIENCAGYEKIFIIGGESIYRQSLEFADKIELTLIKGSCEGDTFFPQIDTACWTITKTENFDTFSFITYTKN
jgi:dihydrofolate reductase